MDKMTVRATSEVSVFRIKSAFGSQWLRIGANMKASLRVLKASYDDGP